MNRQRIALYALLLGGIIVSTLRSQSFTGSADDLADHIAKQLIAASPTADPADAKARDLASTKLGELHDLIISVDEEILWGSFNADKGFDPAGQSLTAFSPLVWTKLYLSTFTFPGEYTIRHEGKFTVLDIKAHFRDRLDMGDYPYPFWHSAKKWEAYVSATDLLFTFAGQQLIAVYRQSKVDPANPVAARPWDGQWHWTSADGAAQPRVALYSYLLSKDNPNAEKLDASYRALEQQMRTQNCVTCHAPDNQSKMTPLVMLLFPNQALTARHTLVQELRRNKMPPPTTNPVHSAGISDDTVRREMLLLAEDFEKQADAALAYESAKRAASIQPANR